MPDQIETIPELVVRHAGPDADFGFQAAYWEHAEAVEIGKYWSGENAPPERRCTARLLWSSENLLARFDHTIQEPLVADPDPDLSTKSIGLWERDVCELFIVPKNRASARYFEFEIAPNGEWLDLSLELIEDGRATDWDFRSLMKAESRISEGSVSMILSVPWISIGGTPDPGEARSGNLFRLVGSGDTRGYLAWSPTLTDSPDFHVPERFGSFIFV